MRIGVPREIKPDEYRVGLTPTAVREYVARGHEVLVEQGSGAGAGYADEAYARALLHQHLMAAGDIFANRGRRQPDPVFVRLDFARHADAHGRLLMGCLTPP